MLIHAYMQTVMKLIETPCYTNEQRLELLDTVSVEQLNRFCTEFRTSGILVESVVVGDLCQTATRSLMHELVDKLKPLALGEPQQGSMLMLDKQYKYVAEASLFHEHDESEVLYRPVLCIASMHIYKDKSNPVCPTHRDRSLPLT